MLTAEAKWASPLRPFRLGYGFAVGKGSRCEIKQARVFKGGLHSLGLLALPGGLWAAPAGFKPSKKPNLVFGTISDTHLRTDGTGKVLGKWFSDRYLISALGFCGDRP